MHIFDRLKLHLGGDGRTEMVKKNVVASFALKGVSVVVSFLLAPLTLGYLSKEPYGIWLSLSTILMWICFFDLGFSQGLKNKLVEAIALDDWKKGKSLVSTTYFLMFIIFAPICIGLEFLIPYIDWCALLKASPEYANEIACTLHMLVALIGMQLIFGVIVSVAAAFQQVALSNSFVVIGNFISLIVIYVLTKTVPSSLFLLAGVLASAPVVVLIIASVILFAKKYRNVAPDIYSIDFGCVKNLFNLGYKICILNVQSVIVYQTTNILISHVSSPVYVAYYNIAFKYLNIAMMAYSIILTPLWPAYTDAYFKHDYDWMRKMYKKMNNILRYSFVGCVILILISRPVYKVWMNNQIDIPLSMTLLVAFYVMFFCWRNLNGTLLVGMGTLKLQSYIAIVDMTVHIPLSLILGTWIGGYGVIMSMLIITFSDAVIFNIQVRKILNKSAIGIWGR